MKFRISLIEILVAQGFAGSGRDANVRWHVQNVSFGQKLALSFARN
jgi:hypothetical protein